MRIRQSHKRLSLIFDMHVVLVAEVLDPMHPPDEARAVRLADGEMLRPDADRLGASWASKRRAGDWRGSD